jgi:hypothetical protein
VEVLEDHAGLPLHRPPLTLARRPQVDAEDAHRPARRPIEPLDQSRERALARTTGADQPERGPRRNLQIDPVERAGAVGVLLGDVAELYRGAGD